MVSYKALNTTIESPTSNTCQRIRNRNGGEATAPRESTVSNTFHGIRNRDGGEATAIRESSSNYY